ncbi:organ-specific protein P4 [Momordica charantia]|uniref:Organ-specific protein P4 n=1 Tax=Momordica charantia TaxID=3673 RepID=A0A6J1D5L4_MOMCH|nr:organ-specific protein P4 [Momordica charantia]
MKLSVAFFLLLSLLLFAEGGYGRKDQGEYWKKIMKEEEIPEVLKELLYDDSVGGQNERFMSNFDPHPNAIIYHSHSHGAAAGHEHSDEKIKAAAGDSAAP